MWQLLKLTLQDKLESVAQSEMMQHTQEHHEDPPGDSQLMCMG